jgi:hypothetical protein
MLMGLRDLYIRFLIYLGADPPPGYEEPISKEKKIKLLFQITAFAATVFLLIFFIIINLPFFTDILTGKFVERISVFSVAVDIVIGFFTIWGLYWAASEFAEAQVRPKLHLIIGTEHNGGIFPLPKENDQLRGQCGTEVFPQVLIGLFLENQQPRAAQFVRVTLRLKDVPKPLEFKAIESTFEYYKPKVNTVQHKDHAIFLQFDEDLVVYKGDGVFLGAIRVIWPRDIQPKKITLAVGLYSLMGEPRHVTISRPITWIKPVP